MIVNFFTNAIIDLVSKLNKQNCNNLVPTSKTAEDLLDYLLEENKTRGLEDLLASLTKEDHKILRDYLHKINPRRKRPHHRIRLVPVQGDWTYFEVTFREPPANNDKDEPPRPEQEGSARNYGDEETHQSQG